MAPVKAIVRVPVRAGADGVVGVSGTRVTLETIISGFNSGATPEEVAQQCHPPLNYIDAVIAYCLQLETLTLDVLKSSEIEGEHLNPDQVRSSMSRRLGLDAGGTEPADRHVEGMVEMMLDATQRFAAPLTAARLFDWHAALFPTGRSGMRKITVGAWRDDASGPMQVVAGPLGREQVHCEPPAAPRLPNAMAQFVTWANESDRSGSWPAWAARSTAPRRRSLP